MFSIEVDIRSPGTGGRRAVIADDDPDQRAALARHLAERGFAVSEVLNGFEALSVIGAEAPCVALMRRRMAEDDGERAAALASMLYPRTRIILTTNDPALAQPGLAQPGLTAENSPFTVLARPVDLALLDRCLDGLAA